MIAGNLRCIQEHTVRRTSPTLREPGVSNVKAESEVNYTRDGGVSWPMEGTWTQVLKWEFERGTGRLCVSQEQVLRWVRQKSNSVGRSQIKTAFRTVTVGSWMEGRKELLSSLYRVSVLQETTENILDNHCPTDWMHLMLQNCTRKNGWESKFYFFNTIF